RYRTYKKVYPKITETLTQPYETDGFDTRSIHLGLYSETGNTKKLTGYCRLILPEAYQNLYSEYMIKSHYLYPSDFLKQSLDRMYFLKLTPSAHQKTVNSYCRNLEETGKIYAETSRFIIEEAHRNLSLSAFFAQSMFAIAESLNMDYNFFSCNIHHSVFYKKYGLTPFEPAPNYQNDLFEREDAIFGTQLNITNTSQAFIKILRLQLEEEQQTTFRRAA
ncbi:MAG: hypothetical protein ABIS37_15685, partial [Bacteroidia bacterium]